MFYPVDDLRDETICLRLDHTCDAQPEKHWLPAYYFHICLPDGTKAGQCDLRIGHNEKTAVGGNIGYAIDEAYRGHHYAARACVLLFRQAKKHRMAYAIITCDPANGASARTCELAGGQYLKTAPVPQDNEMYAEGKRQVMIWRFDFKYDEFLSVAARINEELQTTPLLFGSLGLERRLGMSLQSDDIDVLLPERFLGRDWPRLISLMHALGYRLVDEAEHEFVSGEFRMAFAAIENLEPFAGVNIQKIPLLNDNAAYLLLDLEDYLRVYTASSRDGYRRDVKNKQDQQKINLIWKALHGNGPADHERPADAD